MKLLSFIGCFQYQLDFQRSEVMEQRKRLMQKRQEEQQRQREQQEKAQKDREYRFSQPKIKVSTQSDKWSILPELPAFCLP